MEPHAGRSGAASSSSSTRPPNMTQTGARRSWPRPERGAAHPLRGAAPAQWSTPDPAARATSPAVRTAAARCPTERSRRNTREDGWVVTDRCIGDDDDKTSRSGNGHTSKQWAGRVPTPSRIAGFMDTSQAVPIVSRKMDRNGKSIEEEKNSDQVIFMPKDLCCNKCACEYCCHPPCLDNVFRK